MYGTYYKPPRSLPAGNFEDPAIITSTRISEPDSSSKLTIPVAIWKRFLRKYIEPDHGLIDRLLSYELLSKDEFLAIRTVASVIEKNEVLLNCVVRNKIYMYPQLLTVLKETNQSHLADYLTPDGLKVRYNVNPFSGQRLLTDKEEMSITVNWEILLELIERTSYLSQKLHSIGVLNRRQMEYISGQPGDIKRNEVLLENLKKRTVDNFHATIYCLRRTGQQYVADILEGGVSARIRCMIMDASQRTVPTTELEKIVTRFSKNVNAMLELKDLGWRSAKFDNEITFYFHFTTLEKLEWACEAYDSGEMEASARRDIDSLQLPINQLNILFEWPENDFRRCMHYFYRTSSTTASCLDMLFSEKI